MTRSASLDPRQLAPLFIVTALIRLAALLSRFPPVGQFLPAGAAEAVLLGHGPLLLLEGDLEGQLRYGKGREGMPLWMRIDSRPVKLAFTFAFTYLAVVVLQTWDISIGPMDLSPPAEWPLARRAMWFGIGTVGMFFPNYLATTAILIPVLRFVTAPFRRLPRAAGILGLAVLAVAISVAAVFLLDASVIGEQINALRQPIEASLALALGVTLGLVLVPLVIELVRS